VRYFVPVSRCLACEISLVSQNIIHERLDCQEKVYPRQEINTNTKCMLKPEIKIKGQQNLDWSLFHDLASPCFPTSIPARRNGLAAGLAAWDASGLCSVPTVGTASEALDWAARAAMASSAASRARAASNAIAAASAWWRAV